MGCMVDHKGLSEADMLRVAAVATAKPVGYQEIILAMSQVPVPCLCFGDGELWHGTIIGWCHESGMFEVECELGETWLLEPHYVMA